MTIMPLTTSLEQMASMAMDRSWKSFLAEKLVKISEAAKCRDPLPGPPGAGDNQATMKAGGKPIAIAFLCLAGGVGILWAVIVVPPWIREERAFARLKSSAPKEQNEATESLAEMGSVKAIPAILEIMGRRASVSNSNDDFNFKDPLKSIIEKRGYEAVFPLVSKLNSPDRNIRSAACELLGDIGTEARIAIPFLVELL